VLLLAFVPDTATSSSIFWKPTDGDEKFGDVQRSVHGPFQVLQTRRRSCAAGHSSRESIDLRQNSNDSFGVDVAESSIESFMMDAGEGWFVELSGIDRSLAGKSVDDHFDEADLLAVVASAIQITSECFLC